VNKGNLGRALRSRMAPKKIIIDTDPGVGKLARRLGPHRPIQALTVVVT